MSTQLVATQLVSTLLADPASITETVAALLTAGYLARLLVPSRIFGGAGNGAGSATVLSGDIISGAAARNPRSRSRRSGNDLYERMLRLFAVGEHISLPKRSLRCQDGIWWRA